MMLTCWDCGHAWFTQKAEACPKCGRGGEDVVEADCGSEGCDREAVYLTRDDDTYRFCGPCGDAFVLGQELSGGTQRQLVSAPVAPQNEKEE